ncbi:MAG: hypothetical protein J6X55_12990 [Victivallales bacterium]|nr:hypothetical protein [Victivallales bacterium]
MKKKFTALLLLCSLFLFASAVDFIQNPLMEKTSPNKQPQAWSIKNGTWKHIDGGFELGASTLAVQQLKLPLGQDLRLKATITATEGLKYRMYAEYYSGKQTDGTPERWRNSGANWLTGTAKPQEFIQTFQVEFKYAICHLAIQTEKGEGSIVVKNLTLTPFEYPIIENADFSSRDDNNLPKDWRIRGASITYEKNDADVTIQAASGKSALIFKVLRPKIGTPTEVTFEVNSESTWRSYVEWYEGEKYYRTDALWQQGTKGWKPQRLIFKPNSAYHNCILVFAIQQGAPLSIRKLKAETAIGAGALGGIWDIPMPHLLDKGKIDVFGQKGAVTLRGIPVKANQRYRISYIATGLDNAQSLTGFHEINTKITPTVEGKFGFNDARNAPQRKYQTFTVPENFNGKSIDFALSVASPGTVRFSDFTLDEIPVDPTEKWELIIESPFYRNTIFSSDKQSDIRLKVFADGEANHAKAILTMPDNTVRTATADFKGKHAYITLPPWSGTDGKAKLDVAVLSKDGKILRTFSETLQKIPTQPREIKAHPNGYFTCNGEWLFPIVAFDLCCSDMLQEIYTYAQHGFTLIRHNYGADPKSGLQALDMAQRCGVKLCFYIGFPHRLSEISFYKNRLYKAYPPEIRNHPAFFGYFIADEPLWGGVPYQIFQEVYAIHQEFDPVHPTWINAAPRNEVSDLKPYGASCDIYGVDIYPVPWPNNHSGLDDKTPTSCGKYALRMAETVNGRKPIINWLQGFSWHEFGNDRWNPKNPKPYPTLMQSRFMVYDTLLNGGTGYGIYGIRYALHNEFIEEILQIAKEANGMSRLFVEGKRLPDFKTTTDDLRVAAIEYNGSRFFFILNLTDKPISGAIADTESAPDGLHDYVSGAAVDFKHLELGPYGVLTCGPKLPPSINPIPPAIPELEAKGSPFPDKIKQNYKEDMRQGYEGKGLWIWDASSVVAGGKCAVFKAIDVSDTSKDAFAYVAADDAFVFYVNGRKIAESDGWSKMLKVDIKPFLVKGKNHIIIHGIDAGGLPCGILAELQIDGQTIVTDTSWLTLPVKADGKNMPTIEEFATGQPAKIITPYGGGAWGRKVKIHEYIVPQDNE